VTQCASDLVAQPGAYSSSYFAQSAHSFSVSFVVGMPSGFGKPADPGRHLVTIVRKLE